MKIKGYNRKSVFELDFPRDDIFEVLTMYIENHIKKSNYDLNCFNDIIK